MHLCVKQTIAALSSCLHQLLPMMPMEEHTKLILHVVKHPSCNLWTQTQPHHLLTSGQLQAGHQLAVSC